MNNILFDGVEASRLTLADAILEGILPTPVYVSYNYSLFDEIEVMESRIAKFIGYPEDKMECYKVLQELKTRLEKTLTANSDTSRYLKTGGKIIAFSSTKDNINSDKLIVESLFDKIDNTYYVHSGKKRDENKEALKKFRAAPADETSVLYSIDILNQGVHVKDVDKIFMMRKTTSPIIYFQQLGRLLSYSRRKDEVVVFDFVNNIRRHPVIYCLYEDIVRRANELTLADPSNKERYEHIIDNFKIVDETSKISEEIDKYLVLFSKDNLLKRRLYKAVSILENPTSYDEAQRFCAVVDINKYFKYIDIELFERISKIDNVTKPIIFNLSLLEFNNVLNGKENLNQRFSKSIKKVYIEMQNFVDLNNRLPSIFSDDIEEKELAKKILNSYNMFNNDMICYVNSYLESSLSLYERIMYDYTIGSIDIKLLVSQVKEAIKLGCVLNEKIYEVLGRYLSEEELKEIYDSVSVYGEYRTFLDELNKRNNDKKQQPLNEYAYHQQFEESIFQTMNELYKTNIDDYVDKLFKEIKEYMIKYNTEPSFYHIPPKAENIDPIKLKGYRLFCKRIILAQKLEEKGYLKELNDLAIKLKVDEFNKFTGDKVKAYIDFIITHEGSLPSAKNTNSSFEVGLAKFYIKNYKDLSLENIEAINRAKSKFPSKKEIVLAQYIDFIKKHNRKPMVKNAPEEELELESEFNRWFPYFTDEEKKLVAIALKSVNKYKGLSDAYIQLQKSKNKL